MKSRKMLMLVCLMLLGTLLLTACQTAPAEGTAFPTQTESAATEPTAPEEAEMMKNGSGVAVTELDTLTEEHLKTLKDAGITFVKVHIPYPYESSGKLSNSYIAAKRAVKMIYEAGLEPVCQSFTPGGHAYNAATGRVEWMSYLPGVFKDYDDEYFYKLILAGCQYIGKDLKNYANCWIISNEPNLSVFTGPMTFGQIANYINTCAEGIKQGNPNAYCGVNLFGSADKNRAMKLIELLYTDDATLDYLGLDSYFGTLVEGGAESWDSYISTYYNVAKVPIMITEFSYSSYVYNEEDRKNDSTGLSYNSAVCRDKQFSFQWEGHERNEQTQVDYAKACLEIFKSHPEVIGWCWFSNIDKDGPCWECGDTKCPMESSWGLMHADGTPKPVLNVFKEQ